MKIQKTQSYEFNASAERAWEINGGQFSSVGEWSRQVIQSRVLEGAPVGDADVAGRVCRVKGFGDLKERLIDFSNETRSLTILVDEGLPFFVQHSQFSSRIMPISDSKCRYELTYEMQLSSFWGFFLGPILKRQLRQAVTTIVEDLRYYAEENKIHPDKQRTLLNMQSVSTYT